MANNVRKRQHERPTYKKDWSYDEGYNALLGIKIRERAKRKKRTEIFTIQGGYSNSVTRFVKDEGVEPGATKND